MYKLLSYILRTIGGILAAVFLLIVVYKVLSVNFTEHKITHTSAFETIFVSLFWITLYEVRAAIKKCIKI